MTGGLSVHAAPEPKICDDGAAAWESLMKPPIKRFSDLKGSPKPSGVYAAPTPKVSRLKKGKVLTAAEKAAFLATREDLKPKG